jgi:hypothetical protein
VVRVIIALIIIAGVLMLFGRASASGVGAGGGGTRLTSGGGNSAMVPGYRSEPPTGGRTAL